MTKTNENGKVSTKKERGTLYHPVGKNQKLGLRGENEACRYLQIEGYRIIERNFRCKTGEIDVIALDQGSLVFVEVKTRRNRKFGPAAASVTKRKKLNMIKCIGYYLKCHPELRRMNRRVDVLEVYLGRGWQEGSDGLGELKLNLIKNISMEGAEYFAV